MKAALTSEAWAYYSKHGCFTSDDCRMVYVEGQTDDYGFQQAAALSLHDQPFGFTREDVEALYAIGNFEIDDIAARISALLPPEEDT